MRRSITTIAPAAVAAAFLLLAVSPRAAADPLPSTTALDAAQGSLREVIRRVLPVVVEVDVTAGAARGAPQAEAPGEPPFRGMPRSGLASGIIVQRDGERYYVLTNDHVVRGATSVSIKLEDRTGLAATVVGSDPRKDLALVSFQSSHELPVAELGDSDTLEVGDLVLAVGNPLGFASTVTMGIVSGLGRSGPRGGGAAYTDYIQTDAAINQGNSGGALVNIRGQVIGINTWIAAPSGGNVGLGFAIPVNNARESVRDLITTGTVRYGWLGADVTEIQGIDAFAGLARDLSINGLPGALLFDIYKGSPADVAGLLPGDYVTSVDGQKTPNAEALTRAVGRLSAGRTSTFAFIRAGRPMSLPVTIGSRDSGDTVAKPAALWPGMTVVPVDEHVRAALGLPGGVTGVVVGAVTGGAPAATAGLRQGDLVTEMNGHRVGTMLDYFRELNDRSAPTVTFTVARAGARVSVALAR
jgi:Do/DeqQ family serine protease